MLNQWIAWDKVEPQGEAWLQTAHVVHAAHMPMYSRAGMACPDVEDFMPERFYRPKKSVASVLRNSIQWSTQLASKAKAVLGIKG